MRTMLAATLAALTALLGRGAAFAEAPKPCGFDPRDWCSAPGGDICGAHRNEGACRADSRCRGLPYRGESLVACEPDGKGFWSNCHAVGCVSRSDPPGQPPRRAAVEALCRQWPAGGEGWEIHVWRTARNETTILELRKNPSERAPKSYADAAGRSLLTLPEKGTPFAQRENLRALLLAGLKEAETVRCAHP